MNRHKTARQAAVVAIVLLVSLVAHAADGLPVELTDTGGLRLAGLRGQVQHFGPAWEMSTSDQRFRAEPGYPKRDGGAFELRGQFPVQPTGKFNLVQTLRPAANNHYALAVRVSSPEPVAANTLCLSVSLPTDPYAGESVTVDGKTVALPSTPRDPVLLVKAKAQKILIPIGGGNVTIEGPVDVLVQDDRNWGGQQFSLRLSFTPDSGKITEAALSLTFDVPPGARLLRKPVEIVAGPQWRRYQQQLDVDAGSALDFSGLLDAPAGKYGHLTSRDGHFVFARQPDRPVRFYGTNLCFSANFPGHDQADKLADRLARMGYNSVRLHHYDWGLTDRKAADSVTLDSEQLDKIEYLVGALKKRGIYITIDLYTYRQTRAGEIPEIGMPVRTGYKALVPILDSAMANWQAFARNLLTHRNPYTGMTWAQDPALVSICPLNEDPLGGEYRALPEVSKLYDQRFEAWLKQHPQPIEPDNLRQQALARFLTQTQIEANRRMAEFLRGLGVTAMLTGVNCIDSMGLTPVRAELDYVDNHAYWDHPGFPEKPWSLPMSYGNTSVLAAGAVVPRGMFPTRIVGKPFVVTEFNYCMPNRYRSEGGPVIGAYAALQDWDGLWRFAWSHDLQNTLTVSPATNFDVGTDPIAMLSDRIGILMFLRRDVAPGRQMIPVRVSDAMAYTRPAGWGATPFGDAINYMGLYTRIGSIWDAQAKGVVLPNPPIPADAINREQRYARSDTGQIELAGNMGTFRVVCPRTESFTLLKAGRLNGTVADVEVDAAATVAVTAMDGKDLPASSRLLILHLTDVQNTGTLYGRTSLTLLEKWGQLPHLVRSGRATMRLRLAGQRPASFYPLDSAGKRQTAIPVVQKDGILELAMDTSAGASPSLAYELVLGE